MQEPFFILCPLRSFSSLVCGMLGQHPDIYGMPELNLFLEDRLGPLYDRHTQRRPHAAHGLLRALAQLHEGEQTEDSVARAQEWIDSRRSWSTQRVMEHLRELVAPKILLDKSPATVMDKRFVERMHRYYPDASYLHLTRHPRATGKSILALVKRNHEWNGPADPKRVEPEGIWLRSHTLIKQFCDGLPEGQCMRIKGEELISHLDVYLPQIAEWLGVRTDAEAMEAMKHPESSPYACVGPPNAPMGNDPNFLDSPKLRPGTIEEPTLEAPLDWDPQRHFRPEVRKLAKEFGYR